MKGLLPTGILLTSIALSVVAEIAVAADASAQTAPANRYAKLPYPGAEATVTALLSKDLSDREAQTLFGHLFARHDDFETVVELLEEQVDEQPEVALVQLRFGQAACQLAGHPDTGMLGKAGLAGDCRDALETASKLDPKLLNAWRGLFDFYRQAPGVVGGGVDKAEALLPTIAALDPVAAELAQASLAMQLKNFGKMREHYAKAASLKPERADEIRLQEVLVLMRLEDYPAAHTLLKSLQQSQTADALQVQYQLGRIAVLAAKSDWYADAEKCLLAYLEQPELSDEYPAKSWAAFRLGQLYELMGKTEQSKQRYQWAASQKPDEQLKAELKKKGLKV